MALADLFRPRWRHSNWKVRKQAVEKLSDQAKLATIATTDSNFDIRHAAVERLQDQRVLAELVKSESPGLRRAAIERLIDPVLLREVAGKDSEPSLRLTAALRLAERGDAGALEQLRAMLAEGDLNFRAEVARALGKLRDVGSVEPLLAALRAQPHKDFATALGDIGDRRAVDALVECLEDTTFGSIIDPAGFHLAVAAAEALAKIGDEGAVQRMFQAIQRGDEVGPEKTRFAIMRALEVLVTERSSDTVLAALDSRDLHRVFAAVPLLPALKRQDVVGLLARRVAKLRADFGSIMGTCHDKGFTHGIRAYAVEVFAAFGNDEAMAALRSLTDDPAPYIRDHARAALAKLRP